MGGDHDTADYYCKYRRTWDGTSWTEAADIATARNGANGRSWNSNTRISGRWR